MEILPEGLMINVFIYIYWFKYHFKSRLPIASLNNKVKNNQGCVISFFYILF